MEKMILNGVLKPGTEIKIDVEDRGYQFGDGIYEVIRVYNGKLFTARMHLDRLLKSAEKIRLVFPYTAEELENQLNELIAETQLKDGTVYLQVTRGTSPRNHLFPAEGTPPVYIAYTKNVPYGGASRPGKKAITAEDIRWLRCDIKSLNLLGNILAKQSASEAGCFEAIQHRNGTVTEGSSSNISIVKDGRIKTHPATNLILNGITRQVMLDCCSRDGIPAEETAFTLDELFAADEVIMTSTSAEITPIISIDGKTIGTGEPGPVTRRLQQMFLEEIEKQCGAVADRDM